MLSTATPASVPDRDPGQRPGQLSKSRIRTRARRGLAAIVATLLTLALVGAVYQAAATRKDRQTYPPPGQLINVGGRRLHLHCTGQGRPTVILEAGNLGMSAQWVRIQEQVAQTTRVCSYDRAGMGWSDAGPQPRDASSVAAELHQLLINAGTAGPYVVVGHSYGGLYAIRFAGQYPAQVAGVVLLDSSHPEQFVRTPADRALFTRTSRFGTVLGWLTRLGVTRAINFLPAHPDLPPEQRGQVRAFNASTRQVITSVREFRASPQTSAQVRNTPNLGDKPLAVVTAGQQTRDWLQLQNELVALSSNSVHREVAGATHDSLLFTDRDASTSSEAILHVVQSVRTGRPLDQ